LVVGYLRHPEGRRLAIGPKDLLFRNLRSLASLRMTRALPGDHQLG
jgi:hypothetical protein